MSYTGGQSNGHFASMAAFQHYLHLMLIVLYIMLENKIWWIDDDDDDDDDDGDDGDVVILHVVYWHFILTLLYAYVYMSFYPAFTTFT